MGIKSQQRKCHPNRKEEHTSVISEFGNAPKKGQAWDKRKMRKGKGHEGHKGMISCAWLLISHIGKDYHNSQCHMVGSISRRKPLQSAPGWVHETGRLLSAGLFSGSWCFTKSAKYDRLWDPKSPLIDCWAAHQIEREYPTCQWSVWLRLSLHQRNMARIWVGLTAAPCCRQMAGFCETVRQQRGWNVLNNCKEIWQLTPADQSL